MKTLYDLELHESLELPFVNILRVPGGWLYNYWDLVKDEFKNGIFIPFSDEFKTKKNEI